MAARTTVENSVSLFALVGVADREHELVVFLPRRHFLERLGFLLGLVSDPPLPQPST